MTQKLTQAELISKLEAAEKRIAELEQNKSEERFRETFEAMLEGAQIIGFDWRYLYLNSAAERHNRRPNMELLGNVYMEMWPGIESTYVFSQIKRCMYERVSLQMENEFTFPEGSVRWFELSIQPVSEGIFILSIDITERKRADQLLKRNESILRQFVEYSPAAIAMLDNDMRYIVASQRYLKDYNLGEQVLTGRSHYEVFPELSERLKEIHRRCLAGAVERAEEDPFPRADGRLDWVHWEIHPWYEEKDRIGGIILFSEVITKRKLAESSIIESEERLKLVLEGSQLGYWDWNIETGEVHRNARWAEMLGYSLDEIKLNVKQWTDLHHPDDRAAAWESIKNHLEGRADAHRIEYRMRTRDGQYKWILDQAKVVTRDEQGRPLRMCGTHTDITERKQAEQDLRESHETAQAILNASTESVFLMELDGTVVAANETTARRLGKSLEEVVGKNIYEHLPPQVTQFRKAKVEKMASDGIPAIFEDERFDVWLENSIYPIFDANGKVTRAAVYGRDITERKRNEDLIFAQRDLARAVGRFNSTEEGFSVFLKTILDLSRLDSGGIYLFDPDFRNLELIQQYGLGEEFVQDVLYYPVDSPNVKMIESGRSYYFSSADPILQGSLFSKEGLHSLAVIPILYQDIVIGCMNLASHTLNETPHYAHHILETLMPEIGNFAVSLRAQEALRERTADLSLLLEAGRSISKTLDARKIYSTIFETVKASLPCDIMIVSSFNPQSEMISCAHLQNETGIHDVSSFPPIPLEPPGRGTQSLVIRSGESMLLKDYEAALKTARANYYFDEEAKVLEEEPDPEEDRPRSAIMVPLQMEGKVVGVLQVFSFQLNVYTKNHLRFVETLAFHASASLSNARLFSELEKRVEERTAEVRDLYNYAPAGYHSLDPNGRFIRINQTELNWLGYTREEILGHPFSDFVTPESMENFRANFPVFKKQGWISDLEFEFIRKDGTTFPILVNATAIYDANGNYLMSRSTVIDITERKHAEQALRESEEQNLLLFEESPVAIVLFDENGMVTRANHAIEALTGYKAGQMTGQTLGSLQLLPEEEARQLEDAIFQALEEADDFATTEFKIRRADGKIRNISASIFGLKLLGRQNYLTTMRDITAEKQAQENLRFANAELERALRMKDEFLANMSHELRTPLNAILGISESLLEQVIGPLNEKQIKYMNTMSESGHHLLELINDVLDLAKINAGRIELDISTVEVHMAAESSLRMIRTLAQKKGLEVHFEIDDNALTVSADERRLKQMLVNLLSNAVKFTPEGGNIGLKIQGDKKKHKINFIVWDTGVGIQEADIRRLFQPFTQLDAGLARGSQGTGLGLVLVSQMARLHAGDITVNSAPGQGSQFTLSIPWKIEATVESVAEEIAPTSPTAVSRANRPVILLVEDTDAVSMFIHDYLQNHNYQVFVAQDGFEGIQKAKQTRPDLILMDIMMPNMDGFETTRRIRSEPGLDTVPIVALTALAMTGDRERCLAAGMNDYLSKPVQLTELIKVIENHLPSTQRDRP